jgi:protein-S-isoprenylcysteine O-methyltransferase Ste14
MLTILHLALVFWMVFPFLYFITAGGKVFRVAAADDGAVLGELSFVSGMACVLVMGLFYQLLIPAALCGCILAACSVLFYDWARRTVVDRNFYIALGGEVPDAVCDSGPYRYVRHPFYLSYMLAFLGVAVGFPSLIVSGVCLLNIGLFAYMAFDDERVLLRSPLAADYKDYKARVGMFLPRKF